MRFVRYLLLIVSTTFVFGVNSVVSAADKYASVYYSRSTGAYGWGNNYNTRYNAQLTAYQNCRKYASDCSQLFWIRNQCGALARGSNLSYGFAYNVNRYVAERDALYNCSNYGTSCRISVSFCTSN